MRSGLDGRLLLLVLAGASPAGCHHDSPSLDAGQSLLGDAEVIAGDAAVQPTDLPLLVGFPPVPQDGPRGDASPQCQYRQQLFTACSKAGGVVDLTLDGVAHHFAGPCGDPDCPEAFFTGGPGVDGRWPYTFRMCRTEQPEIGEVSLGAYGTRFEALLLCRWNIPCAMYAPAAPIDVPRPTFSLTIQVWPAKTNGVEPAGTIFVPIPGSTPLELTLAVTSCLPL